MSASDPFLTASPLPYQAPPFDLINDDSYRPDFVAAVPPRYRSSYFALI